MEGLSQWILKRRAPGFSMVYTNSVWVLGMDDPGEDSSQIYMLAEPLCSIHVLRLARD